MATDRIIYSHDDYRTWMRSRFDRRARDTRFGNKLSALFLVLVAIAGLTGLWMNLNYVKLLHEETTGRNVIIDQCVFIAIMLYNSEEILTEIMDQLNDLSERFRRCVHISIVENESHDRTPELLTAFGKTLSQRNISHSIQFPALKRTTSYKDRINYLSTLRNIALRPLRRSTVRYDKLIFLNDVIFSVDDFMRMFMRPDYDAICGMDFTYRFYDHFATRESMYNRWDSTTAQLLDPWPPFFHSTDKQLLFMRNQLIPVFSCWGGAAVFDARPFQENNESLLRFRSLNTTKLQRGRASECCLIFSDLYRLGKNRTLIDPSFTTRYHRQTILEWIVYKFGNIYAYIHSPAHSETSLLQINQLRNNGIEHGLSELDLTCLQI